MTGDRIFGNRLAYKNHDPQRGERVVVIRERFALSHNHDVGDAHAHVAPGYGYLIGDFPWIKAARKPAFTGGAERTAHRTTGL